MEEKKLSYEELEKVATELSSQNRQLSMQVNNLYGQMQNMANMFKRLDYLFKVLEFETSFSGEFVNTCADEIVELMTPWSSSALSTISRIGKCRLLLPF